MPLIDSSDFIDSSDLATRSRDDWSEQIAALMIIGGALAKKAKINPQDIQASADHAAKVPSKGFERGFGSS